MSMLAKLVYSLRVLMPFAMIMLVYGGALFGDNWIVHEGTNIFTIWMVYLLVDLVLAVVYIRHMYQNPSVSDKTIWLLALIFLGFPATLLYWWRWIRNA